MVLNFKRWFHQCIIYSSYRKFAMLLYTPFWAPWKVWWIFKSFFPFQIACFSSGLLFIFSLERVKTCRAYCLLHSFASKSFPAFLAGCWLLDSHCDPVTNASTTEMQVATSCISPQWVSGGSRVRSSRLSLAHFTAAYRYTTTRVPLFNTTYDTTYHLKLYNVILAALIDPLFRCFDPKAAVFTDDAAPFSCLWPTWIYLPPYNL